MAITRQQIESINKDIEWFLNEHPHVSVFPVTADMKIVKSGVSRLVFMDRYAFKDLEKKTLKENDIVILTVKDDPQFPARGIGKVIKLEGKTAHIEVEEEYRGAIIDPEAAKTGVVVRGVDEIDKPLELFYEQVAKRVAQGLSDVEPEADRVAVFHKFYDELKNMNIVPAGRVLYGAGAGTKVTYFNCYVMPYPHDSRVGIGEHRNTVMEIMSRGGGVGTNGSTLRPKNALAKGVNGKSSGAVSWMEDIAKLTNLVQQGGSRRGAQMGMMADWHPDIIEFIISKMQNPKILRFLIETSKDEQIKQLAQEKLKFEPFSKHEKSALEFSLSFFNDAEETGVELTDEEKETKAYVKEQLENGGHYSVHNPEFLTGMNISVCVTKDFMDALEVDGDYPLRFPDIDNYTPEQKRYYDENWQECGDVREWEKLGFPVKTHRVIKAKELWNLINICATYSAEPGIFFLDNANEMTNAAAYGQKVVATNPCGEQPLAPFSVCNLSAINLANMVNKETKQVDYTKLRESVKTAVRIGDNVIDATPYFLEPNKKQALGERRVGLGVMGLADLLIYCGAEYGSPEGNAIVEKVFNEIAVAAYDMSVDLAFLKGAFPFMCDENGEVDPKIAEKFVNTGFMKKMPEYLRKDILKYGIRNSHLLTVAPTGSTGTLVGVSTGLEPYFAFKYYRSGRLGKFIEVQADIVKEFLELNPEYDADNLPKEFITSMELSPEAHADVQCIIQRWIDSSISKTVNAPAGYTVEEVQAVYERLYAGGAKGGTVYVDGSRNAQVLSLSKGDDDSNDSSPKPKKEQGKVVVTDTIQPLEQTSVNIGNEVGDTCPICRKGTVEDIGGCNTCTNCNAQLKCGL